MKVVILAGGLGTRLAEETDLRPKPMVEVGERPILWHIMKIYGAQGFTEMVVATGYKGLTISRYFADECTMSSSMTADLATGRIDRLGRDHEPWRVHVVDTGGRTNTGGRLKRLEPWLREGTFMLTYGDGVCDVDLGALLRFHKEHGRAATITAVRPPARFGAIAFDGHLVRHFAEKPHSSDDWINGGFMVLEPRIFDFLEGDASSLEADALVKLAAQGQLAAYRHEGFWQCMDSLRDRRLLEQLWESGAAPWKVWP
jgi:glucose-1-phosphate cytidylyltransferase